MFYAFDFCLPTRGIKEPDRPEWIHEIKYDGYRIRVERDGDRVRLITRGGYNWTKRYPWIVEAALKNPHKQFVIDGEAVILAAEQVVTLEQVDWVADDIIAAIGDLFDDYDIVRNVARAAIASIAEYRTEARS